MLTLRNLSILALVPVGMAMAGCRSSADSHEASRVAQADIPAVPPLPASHSADSAPAGRATPGPSKVVVTPFGVGGIRAGMTVDAARAVAEGLSTPAKRDPSGCQYLTWKGGPAGVNLMAEGGRIVRIDVVSGQVATEEGARIGDREQTVIDRYPQRISVQPHKYTKGHYLVVTPAHAADSMFRLIFETDSSRVLRYHAGQRPQVEYVEGCG